MTIPYCALRLLLDFACLKDCHRQSLVQGTATGVQLAAALAMGAETCFVAPGRFRYKCIYNYYHDKSYKSTERSFHKLVMMMMMMMMHICVVNCSRKIIDGERICCSQKLSWKITSFSFRVTVSAMPRAKRGAEGVNMGTRFMATKEAQQHGENGHELPCTSDTASRHQFSNQSKTPWWKRKSRTVSPVCHSWHLHGWEYTRKNKVTYYIL